MLRITAFTLPLLALCLHLLQRGAEAAPQRILLTNAFPLANCTIGTVGKKPPAFQGIEVDYMAELATQLGWSDSMWDFECVDSADLTATLDSDTSLYIGALGGQRVQYANLVSGYNYSRPTLFSGLSTLIYESKDNWFFITIISLNVGLAICGTAVGVAFLLYLFEGRSNALEQYIWHAFASIFFVSSVRLSTVPARILQIAYWFMVLIITSTYQANMTALLAVQGVLEGIQSIPDLNTKNLLAPPEFEFNLYSYGIKPTIDNKTNDPTYIFNQLQVSNYDGVTVPDSLASYVARENCNVFLVTRFYYKFNYAMLFSGAQNSSIIDSINNAISAVNANMGSVQRVATYLNSTVTECEEQNRPFEDRILFMSLQGIWILMSVTLGVSVLLHLIILTSPAKKILKFLTDCTILNPLEEIDNYKVGDALIVQNLKDVSQARMKALEKVVKERLYTMDTHIDKFRKLLEKKVTGREINTIVNLNLHPSVKNVKKIKSTKLSDEQDPNYENDPAEDRDEEPEMGKDESLSSVGKEKNDDNEQIEMQSRHIENNPEDFKVKGLRKSDDEGGNEEGQN